ncbi:aromatic-ring-hydroxylating dioxygenase subunit beta [Nocardia pseudovaccinii]|uniref:aromatic-ring-hydroxylating dioxygenase subunit beta n=1 Tax=Nocardia pseudovaccinii TaxID=189540 RepID=UPI003D8E0D15
MTTYIRLPVELRCEVEDLYSHYASIMDEKRPNDWVAMFHPDAIYRVGTHNNVSTTGMWWYTDIGEILLKERAAYTNGYAWHNLSKTLHLITNLRAKVTEESAVSVQAYFTLFAADKSGLSELQVVGRYDDVLSRDENGQLRFVSHTVVIDSETVPGNVGVLF